MSTVAQCVITGYIGSEPKKWDTTTGMPACSFRVGSTKRFYSSRDQEWKSAETVWVNVKAFRGLAEHVLDSCHIGDPVIVVGELGMDQWEKDGVHHTSISLDASHVGHDLTSGTTAFTKLETNSTEKPGDSASQVDEMN